MQTMQLSEHLDDLLAGEHNRQSRRCFRLVDAIEPRQFDAEDLLVQEQDGTLCLVLRRCGDSANNREVGQKRLDLRRPQLDRVALAVKPDEAFNPIDIRLLGANAVMLEADLVPETIEQSAGVGETWRAMGEPFWAPLSGTTPLILGVFPTAEHTTNG